MIFEAISEATFFEIKCNLKMPLHFHSLRTTLTYTALKLVALILQSALSGLSSPWTCQKPSPILPECHQYRDWSLRPPSLEYRDTYSWGSLFLDRQQLSLKVFINVQRQNVCTFWVSGLEFEKSNSAASFFDTLPESHFLASLPFFLPSLDFEALGEVVFFWIKVDNGKWFFYTHA